MDAIHLRPVAKVIGSLLMIEGLFMATSVAFSIVDHSNDLITLLVSSGITFTSGGLLWLVFRDSDPQLLTLRDGYLVVSLAWVVFSAFGALPFYLSGYIPSFTDAYFEAMSGFSTTGASILTDIEALPRGLLFWRSLTHWLGGMGIIVLSIAVLPFLGVGSQQLFRAESPGPDKGKLHPRMAVTAQRLWGIYVGFTLIMIVMLMLGGMNFFESICHAFGAISSGGFSPKNTSIAGYSPYIQYVVILFMFIAGTNFALFFMILKGKMRQALSGAEFKVYVGLLLMSSVFITILLMLHGDYGLGDSWRHSLFQVVSIVTCTGFATADYMVWPASAWFMIFLLMFAGGMAGSTSGGIKIIRHILLFKNIFVMLKKQFHPTAIIPVMMDKRQVSEDKMHNVFAIFVLYIFTFAAGVLLLSITGLDFTTSLGSVVTCMGGIGPGLNLTGPVGNYSSLHDAAKWVLSALMLLGRLEFFTVFLLFVPSFWRV